MLDQTARAVQQRETELRLQADDRVRLTRLTTGAEIRVTGEATERVVICVNGGQAAPVAGTWSASLEWLVRNLAPRFSELAFAEVRYRTKSWRQLDDCVADTRAAVRALGAARTLLVGFSMGGAVAISAADESSVDGVLGLAPWIFDALPLDALRGKRLDVLHGSLDRYLVGIPGVSPKLSRRGFERARTIGVPGTYTLIHGGLHGVALRARNGQLVPLPQARSWLGRVEAQLAAFSCSESPFTACESG